MHSFLYLSLRLTVGFLYYFGTYSFKFDERCDVKDVINIELDGIDGVKYRVSSATRKPQKY